jgi:hypothetical protein
MSFIYQYVFVSTQFPVINIILYAAIPSNNNNNNTILYTVRITAYSRNVVFVYVMGVFMYIFMSHCAPIIPCTPSRYAPACDQIIVN